MHRTILTAAALAGLATPALAACADRQAVISVLTMQHGERPVGAGIQGDDRIMEVFADTESGSWTVIVTNTKGVACIVAAGSNYLPKGFAPVGVRG
ncbi:MAG: hypothetical protein ACU0CO_00935 [Shimia sp.]